MPDREGHKKEMKDCVKIVHRRRAAEMGGYGQHHWTQDTLERMLSS